MKTVLEVLRHPLVIGALVLSILIVVGVYFGSHWYYGDVDIVEIPDMPARIPQPPKTVQSSDIDLGELQVDSLPTETKSKAPSTDDVLVDEFLSELSDDEKSLLTTEVLEENQMVSHFGFGIYPEVPSDYPEDIIWESDMEANIVQFGSTAMKAAELIDRVLIELWNRGHNVTSASMDENGRIYPAYPNTVFH